MNDEYENEDVEIVLGSLEAGRRQQRLAAFFETARQLERVETFDPDQWAPRFPRDLARVVDSEILG